MSLVKLTSLSSSVTISDFGAWLTKFSIGKTDILTNGYEYEKDAKIKRRGGMPILFPNAGKQVASENLNLPQHGFARDMQWQVIDKNDNKLTLSLKDTTDTFALFPFHFICNLIYLLNQSTLSIILTVTNTGLTVMPIAPGFHPYFNLLKEKRTRFINPIKDFEFDGTTTYINSESPLQFELPDIGNILLNYSDNLKNLSYWAQPDGDFICIEPWVGAEGAILQSSKAIHIKPEQAVEFRLNISIVL